jgi:hypothetical protein
LYEREICSLVLKVKYRLLKPAMPEKITFGPKRDEVIGWGRKPNNEELHNLSSSPDIIRTIKSRIR